MLNKNIKENIVREIKIIGLSVLAAIVITAIVLIAGSLKTGAELSKKFIRLHVIANSDSYADQQLKLKIRDGVTELLEPELEGIRDINAARLLITQMENQIGKRTKEIIADEGYDYSANVSLKKAYFPAKQYGAFSLIAGVYEALCIEVGSAEGENWWCVVYPPLCFVDAATDERLKNDLTAEEYDLLTNDTVSVKLSFKTAKIWNDIKMAMDARTADFIHPLDISIIMW